MEVKNLVLVQHTVPQAMMYHGFTVKGGGFFGIATLDGVKTPVFWSGWIVSGCIYLYDCATGKGQFVDPDEDISGYYILADEVPEGAWFAQ